MMYYGVYPVLIAISEIVGQSGFPGRDRCIGTVTKQTHYQKTENESVGC